MNVDQTSLINGMAILECYKNDTAFVLRKLLHCPYKMFPFFIVHKNTFILVFKLASPPLHCIIMGVISAKSTFSLWTSKPTFDSTFFMVTFLFEDHFQI